MWNQKFYICNQRLMIYRNLNKRAISKKKHTTKGHNVQAMFERTRGIFNILSYYSYKRIYCTYVQCTYTYILHPCFTRSATNIIYI